MKEKNYSWTNYLKSAGEEGQKGRTLSRGWQLSFKKSRQQNTRSRIWLKLVPYRTGDRKSDDMYFALSSYGMPKNLLETSTISCTTSLGMPWFTTCSVKIRILLSLLYK